MDGTLGKNIPAQDFRRRQLIQKLRWLGLDDEAERLARARSEAEAHEQGLPLPVELPETD